MHCSFRSTSSAALGFITLLLATACSDMPENSGGVMLQDPSLARAAVVSGDLVSIAPDGASLTLWPYVTDDLVTPQDPVNLVFSGHADPRAIRNALLGLNGDRSSMFPPVFPFTCTWTDAIGGLMAGFVGSVGWTGGAIQLQCGTYGPIRFHLRLFDAGDHTIANAHFELLIPGTTDHQVLSWELAEQIVVFDLSRTGLLGAAPASTPLINAAPTHRVIPAIIYNAMPVDLRVLIGGPPGDVSEDVGIATDGRATLLALAGNAPAAAAAALQREEIAFSQVIPQPFCGTGPGFLHVTGPVILEHEVRTQPDGALTSVFRADGRLSAVPIDPISGATLGAPFDAKVAEHQESREGDEGGSVKGTQLQQLGPRGSEGAGQRQIIFNVAPGRTPHYDRRDVCN